MVREFVNYRFISNYFHYSIGGARLQLLGDLTTWTKYLMLSQLPSSVRVFNYLRNNINSEVIALEGC